MNKALPAYECQVLVGQGGMGAVYRARHKKLDRLVAIKVLRPTAAEDDPASFAERFEREAQVLAKLDHPHIVRIYDYGRTEDNEQEGKGFFYLVLEYVDGASLRDLMRDGRLTAKEALELVPQVCEALQTAHRLGVIHRDIKPENILVDGDGRVRIADFGLAKLSDAEPTGFGLTHTNQTFGTLHYMAPEQMRGAGNVDHRADLYSLGVVLYEMLTGELPLGRFVAPSEKAGAAKDLDGVVFRALESEPDARYQAADELKRDLVASGTASPVLTKRQRRARRIGRSTSRSSRAPSESAGPAPAPAAPAPAPAAPELPATPPTISRPPTASPKGPRSRAQTGVASPVPTVWHWLKVGALMLAYGMFWVEVRIGGGDAWRMVDAGPFSWRTVQARPFSMDINGVPLWLGLATSIGAVILRTRIAGGRAIDGRIPSGLALFGLMMMTLALLTFAVQQQLASLRMGFAWAFFVHGWVAFSELGAYWKSRSQEG